MKSLVVIYDVSDLTSAELDALEGEAVVQGEYSKGFDDTSGHPDVSVLSLRVDKPLSELHSLLLYEADRG